MKDRKNPTKKLAKSKHSFPKTIYVTGRKDAFDVSMLREDSADDDGDLIAEYRLVTVRVARATMTYVELK